VGDGQHPRTVPHGGRERHDEQGGEVPASAGPAGAVAFIALLPGPEPVTFSLPLQILYFNLEENMRATALLFCAVLLVACGGAEEAPVDTAAPAPAPAPTATISLADLAGNWTQTVRAENSDSVLVTATVTATADTTGWTILLPGREPMPVRVRVDGDSIMTATGPYESVLRKGVQVTTEGVARRQADGKLVGITIARYQGAGADSVVRLRSEMTKVQ